MMHQERKERLLETHTNIAASLIGRYAFAILGKCVRKSIELTQHETSVNHSVYRYDCEGVFGVNNVDGSTDDYVLTVYVSLVYTGAGLGYCDERNEVYDWDVLPLTSVLTVDDNDMFTVCWAANLGVFCKEYPIENLLWLYVTPDGRRGITDVQLEMVGANTARLLHPQVV